MKDLFKLISVFCCLLLLFACNKSNNWPEWRGKNRDAKVENFTAPSKWPSQFVTVWESEVGLGNSSPVMFDNKIYLHVRQNDVETAICLNAENGSEIWRADLNLAPEVTGGARNHPGPRSTPCIANGKMFTLGVGGIFNCIDTETGEILWTVDQFTEVPDFYAAMSPIVADNKCIAHLGGHKSGIIIAFEPETGEIIWTIENEPATYSSPVIMDVAGEQILVIQTEVDLLGISYDGKVLWRIPTPPERRFYNSSTPVVINENVIVAGQGTGTKSYKIEKKGGEYSYTRNWENSDFGVSFNTPVLKNGFVYGHEARMGKLFCLDATTGETAWSDTTAHNRFAAMLDLGDILMSLPATGNLLFFKPDPEQYEEIKKIEVSDQEVYAHPLLSGDKIYIKEHNSLVCFQM